MIAIFARLLPPSFRTGALFIIILFVHGCSSNITSIKNDVDILSESGSGYLLLGIDTDRTLHEITIDGVKDVYLSSEDLKPGENYLLLELPVGKYNIRKIRLDDYRYFKLEKEHWTIEVEENVISYAGDISVKVLEFWRTSRSNFSNFVSADIVLNNNSSFALEFLEENYSQILKSRRVVYSGPGEDKFLDYSHISD